MRQYVVHVHVLKCTLSLPGSRMVTAPDRVTYVPVMWVRNPSRADAIENALAYHAYDPWNIIQYLPLSWLCDAAFKRCVSVVVVPRVRIKIYYKKNPIYFEKSSWFFDGISPLLSQGKRWYCISGCWCHMTIQIMWESAPRTNTACIFETRSVSRYLT